MTILKLSKRVLSIIIWAGLGFAIAFALPAVSKGMMSTPSDHDTLSQLAHWQQVNQQPHSYAAINHSSQQPLSTHSTVPTAEMIQFFERRTNEHIDRVRRNLTALASIPGYPQEILDRGESHDASKLVSPERMPYIWLTEFHRRRQNGEAFTYPPGVEEQVEAAILHHVTTNRHHPEFHATPDDMSDIDLIEMVCDWTAIAQELGQNGGSARQWADRTLGNREGFKLKDIYFAWLDPANGGVQPPKYAK